MIFAGVVIGESGGRDKSSSQESQKVETTRLRTKREGGSAYVKERERERERERREPFTECVTMTA